MKHDNRNHLPMTDSRICVHVVSCNPAAGRGATSHASYAEAALVAVLLLAVAVNAMVRPRKAICLSQSNRCMNPMTSRGSEP